MSVARRPLVEIRPAVKVTALLDSLFGIDARSLAVFRVGLAVLVLADLLVRARFLSAYFTDLGIVPRSFLISSQQSAWSFSLHLASGSVFFQALLFVLATLAALALLFGYRTRLATIFSWVLLVSMQVRNPELNGAGDELLRMLLFWGMFLPLGLQWSFDRAMATNEKKVPSRILSFATAALLLQAAIVYIFTWVLKSGAAWRDGSAIELALHMDQLTTAAGRFLLAFPEGLKLLTHGVFWFEIIAPLLLFLPLWTPLVRIILLPLFALMHLAFAVTMLLGIFPFVSILSLIPFVPSRFWGNLPGKYGEGITIFYDGGCSFCNKMVLLIRTLFILPRATIKPAQEDPEAVEVMLKQNSWVVREENGESHTRAHAMNVLLKASPLLFPLHYLLSARSLLALANRSYRWIAANRPSASQAASWFRPQPLNWRLPLLGQLVAAGLFAYVLLWNLSGVTSLSAPLRPLAYTLQIYQHWGMFAPYPRLDDGWFVAPGTLSNGEEIDVFRAVVSGQGETLSWDKPASVAHTFPDRHWRKYLEFMWRKKNTGRYRNLSNYLCRTWNTAHTGGRALQSVNLYFMLEHTRRLASPPETVHLYEHQCPQQ
jgi:predicted DCC family thiol-disulfide oxidoreductase YuxK